MDKRKTRKGSGVNRRSAEEVVREFSTPVCNDVSRRARHSILTTDAGEKGLTMNAEKITKRLINYEKLEKEANDERCRLIQTAESAYRKATKPGKDYEKKLMEGLKPKIDKWLESETECECECCREYPDKMYPTTEGIFIRFDADHPNDIRDYTIPYEDLAT